MLSELKFIRLLFLNLLFLQPAIGFEVDSFYRRDQKLIDSTESLNQEINKRIEKGISQTKTCDLKELYTNVRNQLNADSSGFGVIGGIERWAENSSEINKIPAPKSEDSIYYGTSFESPMKMGFWIDLFDKAKSNLQEGYLTTKFTIIKYLSKNKDPINICKVPSTKINVAKEFIESSQRRPPPMGSPPPHSNDKPPSNFPPKDGPPDHPPGPLGPPNPELTQFASSELGQCLKVILNIKEPQRGANLQAVISINSHHVGADKLGHFFDQGFDYFQKEFTIDQNTLKEIPNGLQKKLDYGLSTEEGMFGLVSTGVKSYGDLAANYGGSLFWKNLSHGENPISLCEHGQFKLKRKFNISDYVTSAWDEGQNCSEYSTEEMTQRVAKNLKAKNMTCPVSMKVCSEMSAQYPKEVAEKILNRNCNMAKSQQKSEGAEEEIHDFQIIHEESLREGVR